jgi:Family of unknown function (DUF6313)
MTISVSPRVPVGPVVLFRIWWRSRARHRGVRYWLLVQGPVVLLVLVALFGINGFAIGWDDAYEVTVQIKSPLDTDQPWVAVVLSLAGWLVWPSVTGAVAGYVLTDAVSSRRGRSAVVIGSRLIPVLGRRGVSEEFSQYFLSLHDSPRVAQSDWEKIVSAFLYTDAISANANPRERIAQAVSAAIAFVFAMPDKRCPFCRSQAAPREGQRI